MPYRVKDLIIDLAGAPAAREPAFCFYFTGCLCTWTCGGTGCGCTHWTGCGFGATLRTPGCPMVAMGGDPADLAAVKTQLQQALKDVEQQEHLLATKMQPQTVAEVDQLETKLKEALEALGKRRAELQKKG